MISPKDPMKLPISHDPTLFLDRDGVINKEIPGSYVLEWEQFSFMPGSLQAIRELGRHFGLIVVVSNQPCIAKGLITAAKLDRIHQLMMQQIRAEGGRMDRVYYCPDQERDSPCRKPNTGMGLKARKDFPEIDFSRSLIIGNNISDMEFGKRLGMQTCFLHTTQPAIVLPDPRIDLQFGNLGEAARYFTGSA